MTTDEEIFKKEFGDIHSKEFLTRIYKCMKLAREDVLAQQKNHKLEIIRKLVVLEDNGILESFLVNEPYSEDGVKKYVRHYRLLTAFQVGKKVAEKQ